MNGMSSARKVAATASLPHQAEACVDGTGVSAPGSGALAAPFFMSIPFLPSVRLDAALADHLVETLHVGADRVGEALG